MKMRMEVINFPEIDRNVLVGLREIRPISMSSIYVQLGPDVRCVGTFQSFEMGLKRQI